MLDVASVIVGRTISHEAAADVPYTRLYVRLALTLIEWVFVARPVNVLLADEPSVVEKLVQLPSFKLYSQTSQFVDAVALMVKLDAETGVVASVTVGAPLSMVVSTISPPY